MTDPQDLEVEVRERDGALVVSPRGDVDLSRSPALRHALMQAQEGRPRRLVVDLSGVDYMDSSGVATLVEAMQIARRNDTRVLLSGMKDRVRSIFEIARLDAVFEIVPTVESALGA
jgi:anti-sigma B factor antagonist